jgi:hypothetical protein
MNLMLRRSAYLGVVALLALSASLGASVARGASGQGQTVGLLHHLHNGQDARDPRQEVEGHVPPNQSTIM